MKYTLKNQVWIVKKMLDHFGVFCEEKNIKKFLSHHIDISTLKPISDYLKLQGVGNMAITIPLPMLSQIPLPAIVHCESEGEQYFLNILAVEDNAITIYGRTDQPESITKEAFQSFWTGLVLIGEKASAPLLESKQQTNIQEWFLYGFGLLALTVLIFVGFQATNVGHFLFTLMMLLGVGTSLLLLLKEAGTSNGLIDYFCTRKKESKINCNAILSKDEKLFGKIPYAVAGMTYFLTTTLLGILLPNALPYAFLISLLGIPLIVYLFYKQAFVYKMFCGLCLLLSLCYVLGLGSYLILDTNLLTAFSFEAFFALVFVGLSSFGLANLIQFALNKNKETELKENQIFHLKTNKDLFVGMLEKDKLDISEEIAPIILNEEAEGENILSVFVSMTCPFCISYVESLKKVYKLCPETRFEIYVDCEETSDKIDAIMSLEGETGIDTFLEVSKNKKPIENIPQSILGYTQKYLNWEQKNKINIFPSTYFNGYKVPTFYTCQDLIYHLS